MYLQFSYSLYLKEQLGIGAYNKCVAKSRAEHSPQNDCFFKLLLVALLLYFISYIFTPSNDIFCILLRHRRLDTLLVESNRKKKEKIQYNFSRIGNIIKGRWYKKGTSFYPMICCLRPKQWSAKQFSIFTILHQRARIFQNSVVTI